MWGADMKPETRIEHKLSRGALALFLLSLAVGASAQPPTLADSIFFGGAGSQRGTAIAIGGGSLYVAGWDQASGGLDGLLLRYDVPPGAPVWARTLANTNFNGLAVTADAVYPVGAAAPGTCGSTDTVGSQERKGLLARYTPDGTFLDCGSPHFFPFQGNESFAAAASEEGGVTYLYAAGRAEQAGFTVSFPFVVVKYDANGMIVSQATEPGTLLGFGGCCPGESSADGLAIVNGSVYLAGFSRLPGAPHFEDNVVRPVLMRYDTSLNRIWKVRLAQDIDYVGYTGSFRAVTGAGGFLYAVGGATPSVGGFGGFDYLIEKYDESGSRIWSASSGGAADDVLTGVVAIGGRLFAVGYTYGSGGADAVVLEIDPATGATLSTTSFGGAQDDFANGAATDGTDLYVVGESRSFGSSEGNAVGDDDVVVLRYSFNRPPVVNAGPDQVVSAGPACSANVTLNGTGSSDPDLDPLTYSWTGSFGAASGATPTVTLGLGVHPIALTVDDGKGGTDSDSVDVSVVDTTPPAIASLTATPAILWTPNHAMVPVTVSPTVSDACDAAPACRIVSVASNEPVNGLGDGDTAPDWQITGDLTVNLRAERSALGPGRVYTIGVQCTDASGNGSTGTVTVSVPKNAQLARLASRGLCSQLPSSLQPACRALVARLGDDRDHDHHDRDHEQHHHACNRSH